MMTVRHSSRLGNSTRFPRWFWWTIGMITVLAVAILILAVVLGVRAGQRQLELRNRQQVGLHLQQAIDLRAHGDLDGALLQYQQVLALEPDNASANAAVAEIWQLAETGGPLPTAVLANPGAESTTLAPTPESIAAADGVTSTTNPQEDLFSQGDAAFRAGQWQDAVTILLQLREQAPNFQTDQVTQMLYSAYLQLGAEQEQENNLETALTYFDSAIALRPDAVETRRARVIVAKYLDVLTSSGADWERTTKLLEELYTLNPGYRDVPKRLQEARIQYGDALAANDEWCAAADQYSAAIEIEVTPGSVATRDRYQDYCDRPPTAATITAEASSSGGESASTAATPAPAAATNGSGPLRGRILYSATNIDDRRGHIFVQPVTGGTPTVLLEDATQPALRGDGQRMAFRNLRNDAKGISSFDPGSGLTLRFTDFAEDGLPSWNPDGNRVVFASTREGDRRSRVYTVWAEANGATQSLGFGEAPEWHPLVDRIVLRGCDETGNRCGLWTMTGDAGDGRPLTTVPNDNRPTWTPDGRAVVFMSGERHGNMELYRVDVNGGNVTRLTNNPALDGLPTVSPDGNWVAFLSNPNGRWEIWAVPIDGGQAQLVAPINGDLGNWLEQDIQWVQ